MVLFEIFKEELPFAGVSDIKVITMISEGKVSGYKILWYKWIGVSSEI